jgi:hypothetical protein
MKNLKPLFLLPAVFGLSLLISGCGKTSDEAPPTIPPPPAAEVTEVKSYPLDICLVSDEKLGSMGDPIVIVHAGQEVKFCCDDCKPAFEKDPAKYLAKLK